MARVFTIEFPFRSFQFRALVVLTDGVNGLDSRIRVFDTDAVRILGNDSIVYSGLQGYRNDQRYQSPEAQELLDKIHAAILQYLNKK